MNNINAQTNSIDPEQTVSFDITKANTPTSLDSVTKENPCVSGKTVYNYSGKQTVGFKRSNTYDIDIESTKKRKISSDEYQRKSTLTINPTSSETSYRQINNDSNSNDDLDSNNSKSIESKKHTHTDRVSHKIFDIDKYVSFADTVKKVEISSMKVDTPLTKLRVHSPSQTLALDGSDDNSKNFNEVVRRIDKSQHKFILDKMTSISKDQIKEIIDCCNKPELIMSDYLDFLKSPDFPYASLKALRDGEINTNEFSTLVSLHGIYLEKIKDNTSFKMEYMNLFDENDKPYERSWDKIKLTLENKYTRSKEPKPDSIFVFNPETIAKDMQDKLRSVRPIEKMFWHYNTPESSGGLTFTDYIINKLDTAALMKFDNQNMQPSTTMRQALSDSAFGNESHRINPVIGISSVNDMRLGSLGHFRDFSLPFPENPLPKTADNLRATNIEDFNNHDCYHFMRVGLLENKYINFYITIGDLLEKQQERYNKAIAILKHTLEKKKESFLKFRKLVNDLPEKSDRDDPIMSTSMYDELETEQKQHYETASRIKDIMKENKISFNDLKIPTRATPKIPNKNDECLPIARCNGLNHQHEIFNKAIAEIKDIMEKDNINHKQLKNLVNNLPKTFKEKELEKINNYCEKVYEFISYLRRHRGATGRLKFHMYDMEMISSIAYRNREISDIEFHLQNILVLVAASDINLANDSNTMRSRRHNLIGRIIMPLICDNWPKYEEFVKEIDQEIDSMRKSINEDIKNKDGDGDGDKENNDHKLFLLILHKYKKTLLTYLKYEDNTTLVTTAMPQARI